MSSLEMGLLSFCCLTAGLLVGYFLSTRLPSHHLSDHSKDAIKMASGMIATLSALVLGLLVASAKNTFDTIQTSDMVTGANLILLDRVLAQYGPETKAVRVELKHALDMEVGSIWPEEHPLASGALPLEKAGDLLPVEKELARLTPTTPEQKAAQAQAEGLLNSLVQARWLLIEEARTEVPPVLYVVLLLWLTILFLSIGLFAPRNLTVLVAFGLCTLSFSTAIYLFDEMTGPLDGSIKVSSAPMEKALEHMEQH